MYVYIVKQGEFEQSRRKKRKDDFLRNLDENVAKKLLGPHEGSPSQKLVSVNQQRIQTASIGRLKDIKISLLCAGQIFGHDDVMNNRFYSTSVQCLSSEGSLYCIKAAEFYSKMSKDERTWNILSEIGEAQDKFMVQKVKTASHHHKKQQAIETELSSHRQVLTREMLQSMIVNNKIEMPITPKLMPEADKFDPISHQTLSPASSA